MLHRFIVAGLLAVASCGPTMTGPDVDGGASPSSDAGRTIDASVIVGGADARPAGGADASGLRADARGGGGGDGSTCATGTCDHPVADGCGPTDLCGPDNSGDGLDNDCNGVVDDDCTCRPGDVKPCFLGPPGRRHVGACQDGTETCEGSGEFGRWGACKGGISPGNETCDSVDNDCNGCVDDNPMCCMITVGLKCPTSMPDGQPFQNYVVDGTMFYAGPVTKWTWTVVGGPCDQLLLQTSGKTSFTLTGANTAKVTFKPSLSGDYTFTMTAMGADGMTYTCTFIVHIRGPGLRVELCWDKSGQADLDLHLHSPASMRNWFENASGMTENDDCNYQNCKADASPPANWNKANSALAECVGGPEGAQWQSLGFCRNPRLDIDNINTAGIPENINVDDPANGESYRILVHYWGMNAFPGGPLTHPMVNIYCGGHLKATYGAAPNLVPGFTTGGGWAKGPMWRVADVTTMVDASGTTTGCDWVAIHPPGTMMGYYVKNDDLTY